MKEEKTTRPETSPGEAPAACARPRHPSSSLIIETDTSAPGCSQRRDFFSRTPCMIERSLVREGAVHRPHRGCEGAQDALNAVAGLRSSRRQERSATPPLRSLKRTIRSLKRTMRNSKRNSRAPKRKLQIMFLQIGSISQTLSRNAPNVTFSKRECARFFNSWLSFRVIS